MQTTRLSWPLRALPSVTPEAGTYPMLVPDCNRTYRHGTIALHLHDYAGSLWIRRRRYRLQPGDITLTPHDAESRYELDTGGSHLCIHFRPFAPAPSGALFQLPFHLRLGAQAAAARERFWRTIDHVRQAAGRADSPSDAAAAASLQELLLWLHVQMQRGPQLGRGSLLEAALTRLVERANATFAEPLALADLAAGTGLSAGYVARYFARRYGLTLQRYLLLRRIEVARHLLITSDLRVFEIGQRVGLPDPQYFNKQFRRVVGQSPAAYRLGRAAPGLGR